MTRKDFELIADVFSTTLAMAERAEEERGIRMAARRMAASLNATHPRFDKVRFLTACGIED